MKATWLNTAEYPFQHHFLKINNHNIHYIDEGKSETILFVHGTPSWSFDFRNVIKVLQKNYRCVAIDHLGFGLSDKPEKYEYTTLNHAKNLTAIIEQLQLKNITLVLHDFGGPIGFHYAIENTQNINKIVVLNSWLWSSKDNPDYIQFSKILKSPLLPFLYRYLNFSPRFLLPQSFGKNKLKKELLPQYTQPFANSSQRNGALDFAKSLLNDQDWFEDLWNKRSTIQHLPVLFVWGMQDKFVKPAYLEKFVSGFTNTLVHTLPHCGHFPQEEHPEEVATFIEAFLKQ